MRITLISCIIAASIVTATGIYIATHYAHEDFSSQVRLPQNALLWVKPATENKSLLTPQTQQQFSTRYLHHYFLPWTLNDPSAFAWYKKDIAETEREYIVHPGYGINHLRNSTMWIKRIDYNMDLSHFPNAHIRAITVANTNIRNLPTNQPSFGNVDEAGQGYPFDNLQTTSLPANTPALILQKTRDGAWSFIITHNIDGWVQTPTLAVVDDRFIKHYETGHYVALKKNNVSIIDRHGLMRFVVGIGKIFPENKSHALLIAVANANQMAQITEASINPKTEIQWPLRATQKNIALIMNAMLGVKYGWGGMDGDSDCSLTTMNLFSTFGIWLPRNSELQSNAGKTFELRQFSSSEKEKFIIAHGTPFLTLIHLPGHIVTYIGQTDNRVIVFQTVWGAHSRTLLGEKDRAIIGATVITPADLGRRDINIPRTWLDKMEKMVLIGV